MTKAPKKITVTLTDGEAQKVRWYLAAKEQEAAAEKRKKELEAEIRDILGDADAGVSAKGDMLIKVVPHPGQFRADMKALENNFPEAFSATAKRTPYTYLK